MHYNLLGETGVWTFFSIEKSELVGKNRNEKEGRESSEHMLIEMSSCFHRLHIYMGPSTFIRMAYDRDIDMIGTDSRPMTGIEKECFFTDEVRHSESEILIEL